MSILSIMTSPTNSTPGPPELPPRGNLLMTPIGSVGVSDESVQGEVPGIDLSERSIVVTPQDRGSRFLTKVQDTLRKAGIDPKSLRTEEDYKRDYLSEEEAFEILLGAGARGEAYHIVGAEGDVTGLDVVAKHIYRPDSLFLESVVTEWVVGKRLEGQGIVPRVFAMYCRSLEYSSVFTIVQELVAGKTLEVYLKHKSITESQARCIFKQLLEQVDKMHQQGVFHRDLSMSNIMIEEKGEGEYKITIIDSGEARYTSNEEDEDILSRSMHGTPAYIDPSVGQSDSYSCRKADMWSLGVVLYHMLTNEYPFRVTTVYEYQHQISQGNGFEFTQQHIDTLKTKGVSETGIGLMGKLLNPNSDARISCKEVLVHPWFT